MSLLKFKYLAPFLYLLTVSLGCSDSKNEIVKDTFSEELDYSDSALWFNGGVEGGHDVDIFYILPTCVWDWSDEDGEVVHYADVNSAEQRELMRPSYELADEIFSAQCNYFAPYYRQISLNSWMEGDSVVEERFPYAMEDVISAFNYFIEHKNQGRPFILAGFSQGGKCVVELLKTLHDSLYSRMVAAYVVGYRISDEEVDNYETISAATGAEDIGVTICYNSVDDADGISDVLSPNSVCINPLNWRTDSEVATVQDSVSVWVDQLLKVLFVDGLDSDLYYIPELMPLLPRGNYHLLELTLYQESLSKNVADRISSYRVINL